MFTGCHPLLENFLPPLIFVGWAGRYRSSPSTDRLCPSISKEITGFSPVADRKICSNSKQKLFEVAGRTPEPDVRVRVRRSVVQVHGEHSGSCTIVPVAAALNGTGSESSTGPNIIFHCLSNLQASYPARPSPQKYLHAVQRR